MFREVSQNTGMEANKALEVITKHMDEEGYMIEHDGAKSVVSLRG